MKAKQFVQIGGVINLLFAVFHLSFWKFFDWQHSLASLSPDNSAIMQVLNIHTAYILIVFFILSLAFSNEIITSKFGRMFGLAIAGFWILRAVNEAAFRGLSSGRSWVLIVICLTIAALYIVPLSRKGAI